jgi:hypothetical protein
MACVMLRYREIHDLSDLLIRHLVKKNVGTIHELSLQGFQATHI